MTTLLGFRKSDFKTSDGQTLSGYSIYFGDPIEKYGNGLATDRAWIRSDLFELAGADIGDPIELAYNKYGKIKSLTVVSGMS